MCDCETSKTKCLNVDYNTILIELRSALTDLLDGQDECDIIRWTGLPAKRAVEIKELYNTITSLKH